MVFTIHPNASATSSQGQQQQQQPNQALKKSHLALFPDTVSSSPGQENKLINNNETKSQTIAIQADLILLTRALSQLSELSFYSSKIFSGL
jgi:hypothetical protein